MLWKQLECQCHSDSRHGPNRIQAILPLSTRGLCIAASVDPRMAPNARCTKAHLGRSKRAASTRSRR